MNQPNRRVGCGFYFSRLHAFSALHFVPYLYTTWSLFVLPSFVFHDVHHPRRHLSARSSSSPVQSCGGGGGALCRAFVRRNNIFPKFWNRHLLRRVFVSVCGFLLVRQSQSLTPLTSSSCLPPLLAPTATLVYRWTSVCRAAPTLPTITIDYITYDLGPSTPWKNVFKVHPASSSSPPRVRSTSSPCAVRAPTTVSKEQSSKVSIY